MRVIWEACLCVSVTVMHLPSFSQVELVADAATARLAPYSETVASASGSDITVVGGTTVGVALASGGKCARCWNYSDRVPASTGSAPSSEVCERCSPVVDMLGFKLPALAKAGPAMAAS